ncbi:MAG: hypothetical protein JWM59_2928, partial [Verrucomicrobiales bacterium]|nr:hypothetical protein [Verrucomicrobiales bacterium]
MHYLSSIIGEPVCSIAAAGGCPALLTEKGFAVCDPLAFDAGAKVSDDGDPSERCEFRRGQIHIRTGSQTWKGDPGLCWNLNPVPDWIVILPFESLPPESRKIISEALPEGFRVPSASVALLRRVLDAYRKDERRLLRLRDALADAGYPSPVTLQPTGLHSAPLRVYARNELHPLPLPKDHRLEAILMNWSGGRETVEFKKPARRARRASFPGRAGQYVAPERLR